MAAGSDYQALEQRVGRVHLQQRLGIETEHSSDIFHRGANLFHLENWSSSHHLIRGVLRFLRLYQRGVANSLNIQHRVNRVHLPRLPAAFEGFRILHLSDLHLDMNPAYPAALIAAVRDLDYELCVITGDFRASTTGPSKPAIDALAEVRPHLKAPVYGILGNHDAVHSVPMIEALDIRLLLNESVPLERGAARIHLCGIDDPHYFRCDNFEKAADSIPSNELAILLSHSPETYRRAAHLGFDLMLSGHTHGGQICLPGGRALITNANCPRSYCAGAWKHGELQGYTSVGSGSSMVDVRFNCRPEVTTHQLTCTA